MRPQKSIPQDSSDEDEAPYTPKKVVGSDEDQGFQFQDEASYDDAPQRTILITRKVKNSFGEEKAQGVVVSGPLAAALLSGQMPAHYAQNLLQLMGGAQSMQQDGDDSDEESSMPALLKKSDLKDEPKKDLGPPVARPTQKDDYILPNCYTLEPARLALQQNKLPSTRSNFLVFLTEDNMEIQQSMFAEETWEHLRRSSRLCRCQIGKLREGIPTRVWPVKTLADGNCLLYAVAKSIWGIEDEGNKNWMVYFNNVLRTILVQELKSYKDFYLNGVEKRHEDDSFYSEAEYDEFLTQASTNGSLLGTIHIFALSNILRRPILLYSNEIDMINWDIHEQGIAGLFLPTRQGPTEVTGPPIAISWSDDLHNHFVPLIPIDICQDFEWPLLDLVFRRTLQAGESIGDYVKYNFPGPRVLCLQNLLALKHGIIPGGKRAIPSTHKRGFQFAHFQKAITIEKIPYQMWINVESPAQNVAASWWQQNLAGNPHEWTHQKAKKLISDLIAWIERHQKFAQAHPYYIYPHCCPSIECKLVPVNSGNFYKIGDLNEKLLEVLNNKNAIVAKTTPQVAFHAPEIPTLSSLVNHLRRQHEYTILEFQDSTLELIERLTRWPAEHVFPVIDLVRVLILHNHAALFYSEKMKKSFPGSLFDHLFKLFKAPDLNYANCLVLFKFLINLFNQESFHPLLTQSGHEILSAVAQVSANSAKYDPPKRENILKLLIQLISNFALLWMNKKAIDLSSQRNISSDAISFLLDILREFTDEKLIQNCLATIATILKEDGCCELESKYVTSFAASKNSEISEIARFIIHLSECKREMKEYNR